MNKMSTAFFGATIMYANITFASPSLFSEKQVAAPYIPISTLEYIAAKNQPMWSWEWKSIGINNYSPAIAKKVSKDLEMTLASGVKCPPWYHSSVKIAMVLQNPSRPIIYFVLVPETAALGSLDANLVYAYDTQMNRLVFKTYVDPEW